VKGKEMKERDRHTSCRLLP